LEALPALQLGLLFRPQGKTSFAIKTSFASFGGFSANRAAKIALVHAG
jgi:hypothetical protein